VESTIRHISLKFEERRARHAACLVEYLGRQSHLRLLTEMLGNTGDRLIWAGTRDVLRAGRLEWTPLPVREVRSGRHRGETLVIPGSGAFVGLWHEWLPQCVIDASDAFDKIVILPSQFDVAVEIVCKCLGRPNVFPIARDARSYLGIKGLSPAALLLDCALSARVLTDREPAPAGEGGTLLALREDEGSSVRELRLLPDPARNRDISQIELNLDSWISTIASADSIVTDRLHVALAAILLGRRLLYLDPPGQKISTYFGFAFGDDLPSSVERCPVTWLKARGFVVPEDRAA
jgi:hypothetical protein